jgi:hypothetical protein
MRAQKITLTEHSSDVVHVNSDPARIILTACDMARVGVRSWPIAAAARGDIRQLEREEWEASKKFTPGMIVFLMRDDFVRSNDLNDTFEDSGDLLSNSSWVNSIVIGFGNHPVMLDTLFFETPVNVVERKNKVELKVRAIFRCNVERPFKNGGFERAFGLGMGGSGYTPGCVLILKDPAETIFRLNEDGVQFPIPE